MLLKFMFQLFILILYFILQSKHQILKCNICSTICALKAYFCIHANLQCPIFSLPVRYIVFTSKALMLIPPLLATANIFTEVLKLRAFYIPISTQVSHRHNCTSVIIYFGHLEILLVSGSIINTENITITTPTN